MYLVTCPHCHRRLRMSREVHRAKMKCRYCQSVFEGSTEPMAAPSPVPTRQAGATPVRKADGGERPAKHPAETPDRAPGPPPPSRDVPPMTAGGKNPEPDPAAAAAAAISAPREESPSAPASSAGPHTRRPPTKKAVTPGVLLAVGLGLVVAVVGILVAVYYISEHRDNTEGAIVITKGNEFGQGDARLKAERAEQASQAPQRRGVDDPARSTGRSGRSGADLAVTTDPDAAPAGIRLINVEQLPEDPTQMPTWVGRYVNDTRKTLARAWIELVIENARGQVRLLRSPTFEYLPPGWQGRFSIMADFQMTSDMRVKSKAGRAERGPGNVLALELGQEPYERLSEDELKIVALAKNTSQQTLHQPVVLCDFFSKTGLYLGSAKADWREDVQMLRPGQSALYELLFTPDEAGFSVMLVDAPRPRLAGRTGKP